MPADYGSVVHSMFNFLAHGVLRNSLLELLANNTDFTRRLVTVEANGKFSSTEAGPDAQDEDANLLEVVTHLKEHLGVRFLLCWHGMLGYWAGV